jgi:hypothetical protein
MYLIRLIYIISLFTFNSYGEMWIEIKKPIINPWSMGYDLPIYDAIYSQQVMDTPKLQNLPNNKLMLPIIIHYDKLIENDWIVLELSTNLITWMKWGIYVNHGKEYQIAQADIIWFDVILDWSSYETNKYFCTKKQSNGIDDINLTKSLPNSRCKVIYYTGISSTSGFINVNIENFGKVFFRARHIKKYF